MQTAPGFAEAGDAGTSSELREEYRALLERLLLGEIAYKDRARPMVRYAMPARNGEERNLRTMEGRSMGVYRDVERDMRQMANYWLLRKYQFLDWTNEIFFSYIDPFCQLYDMDDDKHVIMSMCFTEWLLFECPLRDDLTPLELYLEERPARISQKSLDRLSQVHDTQFFSRFSILDKDASTGISALKDVRTGRRYDVYDRHLCEVEHWKDGTIAERIGCVDDKWQIVGQVRMYDHANPNANLIDGPGEFHPEDRDLRPELEEASYFIRLVRDLLAPDGRYQDTLKVRTG